MGSSQRLWDTFCGWKDLPKSTGKQLKWNFPSGVPWEERRRMPPLPARCTGRHPGWCGDTWPQPTPLLRTGGPGKLSSAAKWRFPSPRAVVHGGSCWECVLINKEYLSNHCHVSILALLSNHRKTTGRRRLQVASGRWWEAKCNFHSLNRSHAQFEAPPRHTEMLKSKMFTT